MSGITLSELLKKMIEMGGSDLHITTNSAPRVRVHGHLRPLDMPPLTAADTKSLAYSVLTDAQKHRFEENLELDFSFGLKSLARFRGNVFNQRGAVGAVFRTIPWEIKGFDALGLPAVVRGLCDKPRGLVLVTGPTGSGKSTTLAAMLDKINAEREEHMITIEDPIEFLIPPPAIRNLVREDKIHKIYSAMQPGTGQPGMQPSNEGLASAYFAKAISRDVALSRSSNAEELQEMINRGVSAPAGGGKA